MNPGGGGVSAWPSSGRAGHPARRGARGLPSGAVQTALLRRRVPAARSANWRSGAPGWATGSIGFLQGQLGNAAIVAAHAIGAAHPARHERAQRLGQARAGARSAGSRRQRQRTARLPVVLDGHRRSPAGTSSSCASTPAASAAGAHRVQVLATDIDGQATLSAPSALRIDGVPPAVKITRAPGRAASASASATATRVVDARSGERRASATGSAPAAGALQHRYAHAGVYTCPVSARPAGSGSRARCVAAGERAMRRRLACAAVLGTLGARAATAPASRAGRRVRAARRWPQHRPARGAGPATAVRLRPRPGDLGRRTLRRLRRLLRRRQRGVAARPAQRRGRRRSPAATPSCLRSARTAATSASRPTKARRWRSDTNGQLDPERHRAAPERVRARHGGGPGRAASGTAVRARLRA